MKRARVRIQYGMESLRAMAGPFAVGLAVFALSTLAFCYHRRNDLLILAAQQRSVTIAEWMTHVGARAVSATDIFPQSALLEYLLALQVPGVTLTEGAALVDTLVKAGASINERNLAGWPALMLASSAGFVEVVDALSRNGADLDARAVGSETTEGMTALMAAAMHGHTDVVNYLIEKGANLHLRARAGFTALLLAASRGHAECVELLLKKGAPVPLSTIQVAERNGHPLIAQRLREARPLMRLETPVRRPSRFPEE